MLNWMIWNVVAAALLKEGYEDVAEIEIQYSFTPKLKDGHKGWAVSYSAQGKYGWEVAA